MDTATRDASATLRGFRHNIGKTWIPIFIGMAIFEITGSLRGADAPLKYTFPSLGKRGAGVSSFFLQSIVIKLEIA